MKRLAFLSIMVVMLVAFTGCKKGNVSIKTSQIDANTMLIKSDGVVQVATVEEFTASYYDMSELKDFINENLAKFNQSVGNETAAVLNSLDKKDGNAIMIIEYANMDYYAQFNEVEAKLLTSVTAKDIKELPGTFMDASGEKTLDKSDLASIENAKIVILNEEYDLIVSSKIKYHAGGTMKNEKEIQTQAEGTVVVY